MSSSHSHTAWSTRGVHRVCCAEHTVVAQQMSTLIARSAPDSGLELLALEQSPAGAPAFCPGAASSTRLSCPVITLGMSALWSVEARERPHYSVFKCSWKFRTTCAVSGYSPYNYMNFRVTMAKRSLHHKTIIAVNMPYVKNFYTELDNVTMRIDNSGFTAQGEVWGPPVGRYE